MANRYWVGGAGTWDTASTANWSTTSGGAAGASAPTSSDVAIFDANSGSSYTVTLGGNVTVQTVTANLAVNLTFDFGSNKITITGNGATVYRANGVIGYLGTPVIDLTYAGSTGTRTIAPGAASTVGNAISLNVLGGSDVISLTGGSTGVYKNLDFTGFSGTLQYVASGSSISVYGALTISSGMTMPGVQNGAISFRATTGTHQITTSGKIFNMPLIFNGDAGVWEFQDALTQEATRAFTITNGTVKLKHGVTSTVGAFATSGTTQKFLQSTTAGAQATLSQASGTVNASNLTIRDINATGGAAWNAPLSAGNRDNTNNTGWNFLYRVMRPILRAAVGSIIQPVIRT